MKKSLLAIALITASLLRAQELPDNLFQQLAKHIDQRNNPAILATMLSTTDFYTATNTLVKGFIGEYPFSFDSTKMREDSILYTHYLNTHINDSLLSRLPKDTKLQYITHTYTIIRTPESLLTGCAGNLILQAGNTQYLIPVRNAVLYNGAWKIIAFGTITTSNITEKQKAPPFKMSPFDTTELKISDVRLEAVQTNEPAPPPPPPPPIPAKPKKSRN